MATIIDALVVTLGLDPKGIKKGAAQANKSMAGVQSAAHAAGEGLANAGKEGAQAFRTLSREALAFFAVMTAGKTLKAFVQDNTATNVALANLSRNLGESASDIAAWQNVARSLGGTADDVTGSMQSLVSQFQTVEGQANLGRVFSRLGVHLRGANGQLRSMDELIPDLAKAAQRWGPQIFSAYASQAGFSQGFINMLENSPDKLMKMYQALKKYAPTDADTKASQQLQESWVKLTAQSEAFGRTIMTSVTPEVESLLSYISGLIDKNQAWIRQDIVSYAHDFGEEVKSVDWKEIGSDVKAFADFLKSIDWQKVGSDIKEIGHDIDAVTNGTVGWTRAIEAIFALWLGSKFIRVMGAIGMITRGIGGGLVAAELAAGYGIHKALEYADKKDKIGTFLDDNSDELSWVDNFASRFGLGRSYRQQAMASDGVPYTPGKILTETGATPEQYNAYARSVAKIEDADYGQMGGAGGKYAGRYQMSAAAISDAAKYLGEKTPDTQAFLNDPQMQERYFEAYSNLNAIYLSHHSRAFREMNARQKLAILGYAHNQGPMGAARYLHTGVTGRDGFGTPGTKYIDSVMKNVQIAMAHQPQSMTTTNAPITNNITINAPGGNPHEIRRGVEDAFRNPRLLARQANTAVQ